MSRPPVINQASVLAEYVTEQMERITVANGFNTDIGLRVFRGRRKIDEDHVPCGVVIEGVDTPGDQVGRDSLRITQEYTLGGYVRCDPDHPNDAAHLLIKDIKRVMFPNLMDRNFGGRVVKVEYTGRDIGPRVDGEPIVFAVVHIQVQYAETLSNP